MNNLNTYWNHKGQEQQKADALKKLVPASGAVVNPQKNKALEKFRKASNAYYDLYNNGLCNRARSFSRVFGIPANEYKFKTTYSWEFAEIVYVTAERKMNDIIANAWEEQFTRKGLDNR